MLQVDFSFFGVESIFGFTYTFVSVCSDTLYLFVFPPRIKRLPLDILKFIVAILSNQDKKVSYTRVDEDISLERSSEFMKTCNNMNIIVQPTGGYASLLNGKI